jgi:hypothetical protein
LRDEVHAGREFLLDEETGDPPRGIGVREGAEDQEGFFGHGSLVSGYLNLHINLNRNFLKETRRRVQVQVKV